MARCEDCLHYQVCLDTEARHLRIILAGDTAERCKRFMLSADVAPKSEVAREIFEEIENAHEECIYIDPSTNIGYLLQTKFEHKLAELKKKYTEDKE